MNENPYRQLPSVDKLLAHFSDLTVSRTRLVEICRIVLDEARQTIRNGVSPPDEATLLSMVRDRLVMDEQLSLRPVINATGVIVHTNLGRAPLSLEALRAMEAVAQGYSNLEYDLEAGQRGKRDTHVEELVKQITGAEAALVVNNNAAAVYLALVALASGHEVIISRGQLVEIGGGFRIPDVMTQSGARLVEVGTTNRTRIADFERAITEHTVALMRIHASNFKVIGFTESVELAAMVELARQYQLFVIDDLGSGTLIDTAAFGLDREPTVVDSVQAGAELITFSGDKLLGGPQAGLIVGHKAYVDNLKRHPLARALRPDKLCLAALTMTLKHYRDEEAFEKIPVWRMISMSLEQIERRATQWQSVLGGEVLDARSTVGGGSLPGNSLPTRALTLTVNDPNALGACLRRADTPVIGRIQDGRFWLDPRTVLPEQDELLLEIVSGVLSTCV